MADRSLWIFEQFAQKFAAVAESMLGSTVTSALDTKTPLPGDEAAAEILAWEQGFDVGDGCRMVVAAPAAAWDKIGGDALKAAGVDELDPDSVRGTYLELLNQALSSVASEIGGLLVRNVSPVDGRELPYAQDSYAQAIEVMLNGEPVTLFAGVDPRLVAALEKPEAGARPQPSPSGDAPLPKERDRAGDDPDRHERQDLLDGSKTLDLLLDVELPVSISFGRASVPLKDVLKLTSGSIVELNRGVSDPVELIVNNCVIARGEVVVVEGNYGVRIQQIISARERLRTLN